MANAELIQRLIEETTHAPDWRSGYARTGNLPLYSNLGPAMYLTTAGHVVMNDEEDGPLSLDPPTRFVVRAAE
jgi:hypothetical protein